MDETMLQLTEACRLLRKVSVQLGLAGIVPLKDSMNPTEALLWEIREFLDEVT